MKYKVLANLIGVVAVLGGAGGYASAAVVNGVFVNPSPAKDPTLQPYDMNQPAQYSGEGTASFTYGMPFGNGAWGGELGDSQGRVYADSDGHLLQNSDGTAYLAGPGEISQVVPPDQIGQYGSRLGFSGNSSVSEVKGQPFTLGYLTFQNGTTGGGTEINTVDLSLSTSSTDPDFVKQLSLTVGVISTLNGYVDPFADADILYFPDYPQYGSFRVFEGTTSTVELLGTFNSLDFEGFGKVQDQNGFLYPGIDPIPDGGSTALLLLAATSCLGCFRKRLAGAKM